MQMKEALKLQEEWKRKVLILNETSRYFLREFYQMQSSV